MGGDHLASAETYFHKELLEATMNGMSTYTRHRYSNQHQLPWHFNQKPQQRNLKDLP
jgi:hypothetical protein